MKITFLYHSSFLVEFHRCTLLFDWYGGTLPEFDRSKPLYVLESHHHEDHYSPDIFSLGMDKVWYILGNSIWLSAKQRTALGIDDGHVIRMGGGCSADIGLLHIVTLPSTDAGVAFLIQTEGKTLFHGGDLNWWHWEGESKRWNQNMENEFKRICEGLRGETIDIAFLVLDPRQEEAYWWGFDWMMRCMKAKVVFPMHSWEMFHIIHQLKTNPISTSYRDRVVEIYGNGQVFEFPD